MKWVEVIEFRALKPDHALLELDFWNSLNSATRKANIAKVEVYTHSTLPTDISIHLHYDSAQVENQGSSLGLRFVSELKAFGVVNHPCGLRSLPQRRKRRLSNRPPAKHIRTQKIARAENVT